MSQVSYDIRKAFLVWSVANILGLSIPPLVLYLVPLLTAISGLYSTTLIISLPLSFAQWIALRRSLPVSWLWILSIPVSILAIVLITREIPERYWLLIDPDPLAALITTSLVIGLMIGLPQWLILRRECAHSSIWLLGSALGLGLGASIVIATDLVNQSGILAYIVAVLFYVSATGLTLAWLLTKKHPSQTPAVSTV
jgi:hypothetical protein